jgi:hypothetical protein
MTLDVWNQQWVEWRHGTCAKFHPFDHDPRHYLSSRTPPPSFEIPFVLDIFSLCLLATLLRETPELFNLSSSLIG